MTIDTTGMRPYDFRSDDYTCYDNLDNKIAGDKVCACYHLDSTCYRTFEADPSLHDEKCPWRIELAPVDPTPEPEPGIPEPSRVKDSGTEEWDNPGVSPSLLRPNQRQPALSYAACNDSSPDNWTCTLPRDHSGDHIGHWDGGHMCARWPTGRPWRSSEVDLGRASNPRADRARELLASTAYEGDHGFTGVQRELWDEQRKTLLPVLALIAAGMPVSSDIRRAALDTRCPVGSVERYTTEYIEVTEYHNCRDCDEQHETTVSREERVENEGYSEGTNDGADWVSAAKSLIQGGL